MNKSGRVSTTKRRFSPAVVLSIGVHIVVAVMLMRRISFITNPARIREAAVRAGRVLKSLLAQAA